MKHYKTKEEIGSGFQHNEKQHKQFNYNSLVEVKPYEKNTMRTKYLIRDIWSLGQLIDLRDDLNHIINERLEK
tara:strand:- start:971 stop:1189 length:219 start_codon:yes stop_codon:yes gene_type:complete